MNIFTRREKIFLLVFGLVAVFIFLFPQIVDSAGELIYLIFVVAPLGYLLATDKDRINRIDKKE